MDYPEEETIINNEYDYSNIIPKFENITYIIQYCAHIYSYFLKLLEEDENKNEKLKYEFKNYNYKKNYGEGFEVKIRQKNYNTISCKNYDSFVEALNNGQLLNIESLEINLNLNYRRGNIDSLKNHENSFKISFRPYDIKFIRKANHNEQNMNQIEENIKQILNKFPVENTIFFSK